MEDHTNDIHRISVPTLHGYIFIDVYDVLYCEADGNYTKIHFKNGTVIFVTLLLADCAIKLQRYLFFLRIHKSHIVNLNFAEHYEKGKDPTLILDDKTKTKLTVSRTHKKEFLEKWKEKG